MSFNPLIRTYRSRRIINTIKKYYFSSATQTSLNSNALYFQCSVQSKQLHGDDSYFIDTNENSSNSNHICQAFGVFDGVGGWSNTKGGDPKAFSENLAKNCLYFHQLSIKENADKNKEQQQSLNSKQLLIKSADIAMDSGIIGGSTALVCSIIDCNLLSIANVGDSKLYLLRQFSDSDGKYSLYLQTAEQMVFFNAPVQIGPRSFVGDPYSLARDPKFCTEYYELPINISDIIIAVSDGVSDNLFPYEIEHIVNAYSPKLRDVQKSQECMDDICAHIVRKTLSKQNSDSSETETPFGRPKPDDITCIVANVAKCVL